MNSIILCEGKTDEIILSYYLTKMSGWKFTKKPPFRFDKKDNYVVNWYKREDNFLLIVGVGGKNNFKNIFNNILIPMLIEDKTNIFTKIAILSDKDNNTIEYNLNLHKELFKNLTNNFYLKNKEWVTVNYYDKSEDLQEIKILSLTIPNNSQGALETALIQSISENEYDKNIADKSEEFINQIYNSKCADKYLKNDSLKLKAHLSTIFSIISPQKVFSELDELLVSVNWEKYKTINDCFGELLKI